MLMDLELNTHTVFIEGFGNIQYRSKLWVHKDAVKPRPLLFCFPQIYCGGTKTATAEGTKATEDRGLKDTVMPRSRTIVANFYCHSIV